jgi:hypothetical protein
MVYTDHSGLNGVPVFLDSRLWENIKDKNDLMAPVTETEDWDCWYEYKKEKFPEKLYFIVKAPKISFDYYNSRSGIIASQIFLDFIKKYTDDISFVPLEVYSNKMKIISNKKYYFIKFNSYLINGFDYEKSEYTPNISDKNVIMIMNGNPWVAKVKKLVLNEAAVNDKDIFCLHGWIFFNSPFISEKLLKEALEKKLYGIRYVEVNKIVDFYNGKKYLEKGNVVIE